MVQFEDSQKLNFEEDTNYKSEKTTLLSKYEIPIHYLDFDYVKKCDNAKEIEKIYKILKSGEEGHYPELQKATEEKLKALKPNSKYLREVCPVLKVDEVSKEEWGHLSNDLSDWMEDAHKKDTELNAAKPSEINCDVEIRKVKKDYKPVNQSSIPKRISSTDYESWDRYDPETEILKMELQDEREKNEALEKQDKLKQAKMVRFSNFATEAEAIYEANSEKERGNECFKAGEFKNALRHYTQSIQSKRTAVGFTNRAITYIKLKKYEMAIKDCQEALNLNPRCFKAHLRLAQSYEALKQYQAALRHITTAIEIDPNNISAQDLGNRLYKTCGVASCGEAVNKIRLTIEDVESNKMKPLKPILKSSPKNNGKEVISIPGSSTMPPPFYVEVPTADPEVVKREKQKIFSMPQVLHITTIDPPSDDEHDLTSTTHIEIPQEYPTLHLDKREGRELHDFQENIMDKHTFDDGKNLKEFNSEIENSTINYTSIETFVNKTESLVNSKSENDINETDTELEKRKDINNELFENLSENNSVEENQDEVKLSNHNSQQKTTLLLNKKLESNSQVQCDVNGGGGEPHITDKTDFTITEEDLQTPYMFMTMWNSVKKDTTYRHQAEILRKIDFTRIHEVIGYNLDEEMLSSIIQCLHKHFMVPDELRRVRLALSNFNKIPRFQMMLLFLSTNDRKCIRELMEFLERNLENNVIDMFNRHE